MLAATSLLERLEAQVRRTEAERDFLEQQQRSTRAARERVQDEIAVLRAREAQARERYQRLVGQAYRETRRTPFEVLLGTGSLVEAARHAGTLAALGEQEQRLVGELRALAGEQERTFRALAAREAELAALQDTLTAKHATLAQLTPRAKRLADAAARGTGAAAAELEVLRELAADVRRAHEAADRLISEIATQAGVALPRPDSWVWPAAGVVSQEFGPSGLSLEPPVTYGGVRYPHFHDALDIAAPLGTPVVAASRGRVAFVGHLPDGAMVVIVVHGGGLASMYAHLDDAAYPPPVRVGDQVDAGDRLGAIGLTGITTGPHLHFVVKRDGAPLDPRALLPVR